MSIIIIITLSSFLLCHSISLTGLCSLLLSSSLCCSVCVECLASTLTCLWGRCRAATPCWEESSEHQCCHIPRGSMTTCSLSRPGMDGERKEWRKEGGKEEGVMGDEGKGTWIARQTRSEIIAVSVVYVLVAPAFDKSLKSHSSWHRLCHKHSRHSVFWLAGARDRIERVSPDEARNHLWL